MMSQVTFCFACDGRAVFSGSADKTVMKIEATTGRVVWTAEGHTSDVQCLAKCGRLTMENASESAEDIRVESMKILTGRRK